jgi:hypothetical protein
VARSEQVKGNNKTPVNNKYFEIICFVSRQLGMMMFTSIYSNTLSVLFCYNIRVNVLKFLRVCITTRLKLSFSSLSQKAFSIDFCCWNVSCFNKKGWCRLLFRGKGEKTTSDRNINQSNLNKKRTKKILSTEGKMQQFSAN